MLRSVSIQQAAARHCQTCVHALPACRSATAARRPSVAVEARGRTVAHAATQSLSTAAKRPSASRAARLRVSAVALMPNVKDDRVSCRACFGCKCMRCAYSVICSCSLVGSKRVTEASSQRAPRAQSVHAASCVLCARLISLLFAALRSPEQNSAQLSQQASCYHATKNFTTAVHVHSTLTAC
jgi:hypothetical protein